MPWPHTLGWAVIEWIEDNLVHGPGDVQGQPILLDDDQATFLLAAYALDAKGRRLHRRCWYSAPKGRAKSELAAMIVCAEALGPVRFDRWGDDGEPVGRRVPSPTVLCVATEETQATSALYEVVTYMLAHGRTAATPGLSVGMTRTLLPEGGIVRPISAKAGSKDGGRESFVAMDETHLAITDNLRSLHRTLVRNLAKRRGAEPWMLEVGTMYAPGEDSVAERTHAALQAIGDGTSKDTGLYGHLTMGPAPGRDFVWEDDAQLREAFAIAYGEAAEWMDLDRLVVEARDPTAERDEIIRFFLNRPAHRGSTWLRSDQWDATEADEAALEDGEPVALGWHGKIWDDSAALVGVSFADPPVVELLAWWPGTMERPVDPLEVNAAVERAFRRFRVVRCYADPDGWETSLATWADEHGKVVRPWRTNRHRDMAAALESFRSAVRLEALVHAGGEPGSDADVLRSHLLNAQAVNAYGHLVIRKPTRVSTRRINAATSATLAWAARTDAIAAGEYRPAGGGSKRLVAF